MRFQSFLAVTILAAHWCVGQVEQTSQPQWQKEQKSDALRGTQFLLFSLDGKYLTPPKDSAPDATPKMVVRCIPGSYAHGRANGKFINGYVFVGGVVNSQVYGGGDVRVHVQFRLNDSKLQDDFWSHSTDYSSVFFPSVTFNNLLYGHMLPHKENSNPQVRKVVIGLQEYLGGEVVMQFDMPEATEVAESCGVTWHK